MKYVTIILFGILSLAYASIANAAPRGTADYYLEAPDRYLGNSVSLFVIQAKEIEGVEAPEKYVTFIAFTAGNKESDVDGGAIKLYVREIRAKAFAEKYSMGWIVNGKPKTKQISGKFMKAVDGDGYAVMMN